MSSSNGSDSAVLYSYESSSTSAHSTDTDIAYEVEIETTMHAPEAEELDINFNSKEAADEAAAFTATTAAGEVGRDGPCATTTTCESKGDCTAQTAAFVKSPPLSERSLSLLKTALGDIKTGRHSGQLPNTASGEASLLQARADQLQKHLRAGTADGLTSELQGIANEYYRLVGWLQPGQTLVSKALNVEFSNQNGQVHSIACNLSGSVRDLKEAIGARVGGCGSAAGLQLLCNGEPMTDDAQCLYEWSARHGLGLRPGVCVQAVVRNVGG